MNTLKPILLFFIISITSTIMLAQPNCDRFLLKKCGGYGYPFKYSGQTKSVLFEKGQTSSFNLVTYGGYEYYVTICPDKNFKNTFFKIRENNPEKTVLYDSSMEEEDYLEKQFFVKTTKKLIIEVTVPEGDLTAEEEEYDDRIGCLAVVVEYNKAPKKGFDD